MNTYNIDNVNVGDIVNVFGAQVGKTNKRGWTKVKCPISSNEFEIHEGKNIWKCWKTCSDCPSSGKTIDLYSLFSGERNRWEVQKKIYNTLCRGNVYCKAKPKPRVEVREQNNVPLASAEETDKCYRALLSILTLNSKHMDNLKNRGLTEENIQLGMYASLPIQRKQAFIISELKKKHVTLEGIPGIYK